ncbi:putative 4-methyl-5(beta-hydroxyethyl)-thiazole monophosphate synthesis protein [Leptomonas pyrrhocoris]|uniref:Putative 4-methyl-5(Beta-hydroxyethyl)-thiazole monophosphate synthesis protein n=1 Tax=Leptomonas pyrrhocoris TaxID=157538 RepID=A0A0M9G5T7_LEPPY|nr:putative 4-methyl-5(beta-hydroxyethyl)-thiazole monophosphate synthesis protein [Leptomonas pyrrhocoris]KPA83070.1 putative 4-methyl-5(beta-hydroxyethyl)-thiazole monophosphate synthesis protein [Leptomonas pyrrhocoris]|eukprot:XP_015661509.1 putative 4-methyl-5(beta-hydroxyethyl)-thiazole monophosphate synthesis protein [Leptomonas pyrrhocoris]
MHVLVAAADHSEDIELVCITDVLARAEIKYTLVSVTESKHITLARGIRVKCDALITEVSASDFDAVLLPGGMPGAETLGKSEALRKVMHEMRSQNKLYGAICAAPSMALGPMGLLEGVETATGYPGFEEKLPAGVKYSPRAVVRSGNCLTSKGPGTAIFFGLAAVSILKSPELAEKLAGMLLVDKMHEMDDVRAIK